MDIDVVKQLSLNDGIDVHNNWFSDSDAIEFGCFMKIITLQ